MGMIKISDNLHHLRSLFLSRGADLRIVGGCLRDSLLGIEPKDIDLCTDLTPDEQIGLYKEENIHFIKTGLAHGTLTVILGEDVFEITSLRTETNHDGRHATVAYTKNWIEDLSRRDLSINAILSTFDGEIVDPFNGQDDLKNNRVRFVGNAHERMTEDFLRILRWLRFQARISPEGALDAEAVNAAIEVGAGLSKISKERVWMEVAKILKTKATDIFSVLFELRLAEHIGLPVGSFPALREVSKNTDSPVTMLAAFLGDKVVALAEEWKWSADERDQAKFIANNIAADNLRAIVALNLVPKDWVVELSIVQNRLQEAEFLRVWEPPVFPVRGEDILAAGVKPGKKVGEILEKMKQEWVLSYFSATRVELLEKGFAQ